MKSKHILAVDVNGSVWCSPDEPPPETKLRWAWTDTEVNDPSGLWSPPDGAEELHGHRIDEKWAATFSLNMSGERRKISATMRPPFLETDLNSDHILILDADPEITFTDRIQPKAAVSIVVRTNLVSTRSWRFTPHLETILRQIRQQPERMRTTKTSAAVLVRILKLPFLKIVDELENIENHLLALQFASNKRFWGTILGYDRTRERLAANSYSVALSGRILRGYERVLDQTLDTQIGAYSIDATPDLKLDAREYLLDLRTGVLASLNRVVYLREQIAALESFLQARDQEFTNRLVARLTVFLLPITIVTGFLGMNIKYPNSGFSIGATDTYVQLESIYRGSKQIGFQSLLDGPTGLSFALLICLVAILATISLIILLTLVKALFGLRKKVFLSSPHALGRTKAPFPIPNKDPDQD